MISLILGFASSVAASLVAAVIYDGIREARRLRKFGDKGNDRA